VKTSPYIIMNKPRWFTVTATPAWPCNRGQL